ncbi:hypothetical protein HPB49_006679 [Dermacentor silvarum]|uniref:Uncharacterized protein n=1 Tax=Dermacentor silvarum TaxID=543639 RepID=A0ACB8DVX0_DERSI|nr:hypothetical protein HPB49_006679 [Dermacentor silvarum]
MSATTRAWRSNVEPQLQVHDDDLDDFIDLEADAIISSKVKIKVARKPAPHTDLLMEFNILFKRTIVDNIEHGCSRLCSIILDHGEQDEVVRFSAMASDSCGPTNSMPPEGI